MEHGIASLVIMGTALSEMPGEVFDEPQITMLFQSSKIQGRDSIVCTQTIDIIVNKSIKTCNRVKQNSKQVSTKID